MAQSFKRKRLWVDPPFQFRLLLRMVVYILVFLFVLWHLGYFFELIRSAVANGPHPTAVELYIAYFWKQQPLLYASVLLLPAFLYNLLKFSHRVAGPLYRCRNIMTQM